MQDDPYEILGVSKDASDADIQRAYRKLALKLHPDKNPDDPKSADKFKKVSEAFEVLSDAEKRRAYDQGGMEGVHATGFHGFDTNEEIFSQYGDLFGDLFRSRGPRRAAAGGPLPGDDLRFMLSLPFAEAALGGQRDVQVPVHDTCSKCHGYGTASGKQPAACTTCHGSGQAPEQDPRASGFFAVHRPCPSCGGSGRQPEPACDACHGEGRQQHSKRIGIKIPAGVESGQTLRLGGQGEAGRFGGPRGDLLIELRVEPHPTFEREGNNIRSDVRVPVRTALLGGKVEVPTVKGRVMLTIPPGTSSDRVLRIRGQGIPAKSGAGDHLVRVVIEVPKELSPAAREALEKHLAS